MASSFEFNQSALRHWRRIAAIWGVLLVIALIILLTTWNAFFVYVPPGKHLIIINKDGAPLPPNEVLAEPGQKGIQKAVMGEGWHFVLPIVYNTEIKDNTQVEPGKVGIITAKGGKPLPPGQLLAKEGEKGIQRDVLPPGTYRLNRYGYDVEMVDAVDIKPGYVGVRRRLLGTEGKGRYASTDEEKGILREVIQPGLYYINTKEYEVIKAEVGIVQTAFHFDKDPAKNTAITFTSKGGFDISLDCTVEWEVLPDHMPALIADFGAWRAVEQTVINVQAATISRNKGIDYGVQDFLEGSKREKFQEDFTQELAKICKEKNVKLHSAFIRNIVIPPAYLQPIREKQIAAEKELTNKAQEVTRQTEADVEREESMVEQKVTQVAAETKRIVAGLDRQAKNMETTNQAEIEKLKAEYGVKIATLESQRVKAVGQAEAMVTKLKETATNSIIQLKMDVFQNDGNAFLRYTLAESLNPNVALRLFHSGQGTFWTNMEGKGLNFMMPTNQEKK